MADLAVSDQLLHRAGHILDGYVGIDSMLVKQVDDLDAQSLQRGIADLPDMLGAAVQASLPSRFGIEAFAGGINGEAELRSDHHLVADGLKCLANNLLVGERTVDLRRVEEGDAAIHGLANERDALLLA